MFSETFRISILSAALGFIGLLLSAIDGLAHAANLQGGNRPLSALDSGTGTAFPGAATCVSCPSIAGLGSGGSAQPSFGMLISVSMKEEGAAHTASLTLDHLTDGLSGATVSPAPRPLARRVIRPDEPSGPSIALAQRNLVAIRVGRAFGTGFYIDDRGHLLTSAHVIGMASSVTVTLSGGRKVPGQVIAVDPVRDVALIWTRPVGLQGLPLRADTPAIGSDVYVLGSRGKHDAIATVSRGVLRAERLENGQRLLHSNAEIMPGHSGGPLLDNRGYVIGVTASGVFFMGSGSGLVPLGISYFVPIAEALEALGIRLRGHSSFVLVDRVAGPPITAPTATR